MQQKIVFAAVIIVLAGTAVSVSLYSRQYRNHQMIIQRNLPERPREEEGRVRLKQGRDVSQQSYGKVLSEEDADGPQSRYQGTGQPRQLPTGVQEMHPAAQKAYEDAWAKEQQSRQELMAEVDRINAENQQALIDADKNQMELLVTTYERSLRKRVPEMSEQQIQEEMEQFVEEVEAIAPDQRYRVFFEKDLLDR